MHLEIKTPTLRQRIAHIYNVKLFAAVAMSVQLTKAISKGPRMDLKSGARVMVEALAEAPTYTQTLFAAVAVDEVLSSVLGLLVFYSILLNILCHKEFYSNSGKS